MRLSDFLREKIELILAQWDEFAGQLLSPGPLSAEVLRDHARGIVEAIASDLDNAQSELQQLVKSRGLAPSLLEVSEAEKHGSARFAEGYDVNQAMAEFRALRATVLRLFGANQQLPQADEITRFNEAIDQALAESLARFTALKNRQTRLFEVLLSNSPDLNYIVEPDGTLLYANQSFAEAFGIRLAGLIGQNFFALCGPYVGDIDQRIRKVAASGKIHRDEMQIGAGGGAGEQRTFEYLLVPVLDPQGRCEAVAGSARDITERKAAEEQVRHSANYDSLTDLANRGLFRERLQHELRHAARNGLRLSLLFIDLDRFKEINDQLGHGAGDQLLKEAAGRIKTCVRDTDTVARLGGDEFTVILTDVTDAAHIDNIAAEIIAELRRPFLLDAGEAAISASIGITVFPGDGGSADELVRNADEAMYAAKNAGRDQYRCFTPAMRSPG